MATIKYKGMELEEITEPQIFDPPRKCFVWDYHIEEGETRDVLSIFPESSGFSDRVYTTTGTSFKHCAMLKEKAAPRRFTNRELAKWLSHGKGEWRYGDSDRVHANIGFGYDCNKQHEIVDEKVKIRKWDDTEWHEPTVDYIGIEEKETEA